VALSALAGVVWLHTERASLPLGHHNLLAAWLVILLPLALLPAREAGGWRWLGLGSGLAAAAAVLASRSFLGIAALVVEALLIGAVGRHRGQGKRSRWRAGAAVLLLVLLGGGVEGRRLFQILSGADRSAAARAVYYRAGGEGFLARPVLGWGPGSTAWTAARFLRPRPGVNPPGEVVGELHSLPVELAYELGGTGFLLAGSLAALFLCRRRAERRDGADAPLLAAGLLGLLGAAVAALGSASLAVTALPVAVSLAAGAALAGSSPAPLPRAGLRLHLPAGVYGVAALLLLSPLLLASYHYDQAIAAPAPRRAQDHLARAVGLDPSFPLYRARLGWLLAGSAPGKGADLALRAAEDAPGMGSLWLAAGILGLGASRPWAPQALAAACARDPLSPFAPYFLAVAAPGSAVAPRHAAHALLAEPRLLAAPFWDSHGPLRAAALREVGAREGIDRGWREALLGAARRLFPGSPGSPEDVERGWLALEIDQTPSLSLSLYAFSRQPWPLEWPLVEVRQTALAGLDLPPAATLETSAAAAFRCVP
jgi:hypothetical protein